MRLPKLQTLKGVKVVLYTVTGCDSAGCTMEANLCGEVCNRVTGQSTVTYLAERNNLPSAQALKHIFLPQCSATPTLHTRQQPTEGAAALHRQHHGPLDLRYPVLVTQPTEQILCCIPAYQHSCRQCITTALRVGKQALCTAPAMLLLQQTALRYKLGHSDC